MTHLQTIELEVAESVGRLAVLLTLILVVAFFVAAELALVSASKGEMQHLADQAEDPRKRKAAQRVRDAQNRLEHYLSVTQTGTTAGSLLLGWLGEGATVHWIEPWTNRFLGHLPAMLTAHSIAVAIAFLLVTYVEIALGELIPKVLAANAPEQTALALIQPLQWCSYLFWPLLVILNGTVQLLTGWVARKPQTLALPLSQTPLVQTDPYSVAVPGGLELDALNAQLALNLPPSAAYSTISGFLIHHLGHFPQVGERLLWDELELEAAQMAEHRLETIVIRRVTQPLVKLPQPEPVLVHRYCEE